VYHGGDTAEGPQHGAILDGIDIDGMHMDVEQARHNVFTTTVDDCLGSILRQIRGHFGNFAVSNRNVGFLDILGTDNQPTFYELIKPVFHFYDSISILEILPSAA
jgi:hypothetical protein